jgi:hypothetical protein
MRSRRRNSVGKFLPAALVDLGDEQKIGPSSRDAGVSHFRVSDAEGHGNYQPQALRCGGLRATTIVL